MTVIENNECMGAALHELSANWQNFDRANPPVYECRVVLVPEEVGGFSAHAVRLPGVVSQGETESEAIENIKDAFRTTIAAYLESGDPVPFIADTGDRPAIKGIMERWILVHG